jgi:hypothetical protein
MNEKKTDINDFLNTIKKSVKKSFGFPMKWAL